MTEALFILLVILTLLFAMTNGFIDGGGLVATVITTRALEPASALILVAACQVAGPFLLGQEVAQTLGQTLVRFPGLLSPPDRLALLTGAVSGALIWNLAMWRLSIPSSSSHALVGSLIGAFVGSFGPDAVDWRLFLKIVILLALVPVAGAFVGLLLARLSYWAGQFLAPAARGAARTLEVLALTGLALAHGSNDGQKALGFIVLGLTAASAGLQPAAAGWVFSLLCGLALAAGVLIGSRRIVHRLGKGLYRVQPLQSTCAQASAMLLVGASSLAGYPMSSMQVVSAAVLGAGVAVRPRGLRWTVAGEIALAWVITIPAAGLVGAGMAALFKGVLHVVP